MAAKTLLDTVMLILMLGIVSLLVPLAFGIGPETQALIDLICRSTEDYGFCNKVFAANIHAEQTDMHGLGQISISQATQNVTDTYVYARRLYNNETDPDFKQYLQDCGDAYDIIQSFYQDALGFFARSQYQDVYNALRRAPAVQTPCFSSSRGQQPLSERNREARILIAMSLNTAHELTKG